MNNDGTGDTIGQMVVRVYKHLWMLMQGIGNPSRIKSNQDNNKHCFGFYAT